VVIYCEPLRLYVVCSDIVGCEMNSFFRCVADITIGNNLGRFQFVPGQRVSARELLKIGISEVQKRLYFKELNNIQPIRK
jgi:hypothetical protein